MSSFCTLYLEKHGGLSNSFVAGLVPGVLPDETIINGETSYLYTWPDLSVEVTVMAPEKVPNHLIGFRAYIIRNMYKGKVPFFERRILNRVRNITSVVGIVVEPEFDAEQRSQRVVYDLHKEYGGFLLLPDGVYDENLKKLSAR